MLDDGARRALAPTRFADVQWHDEVDSTNELVLDLARRGAPEGVVVVADHQRAGRGRLGRTWEAPPGSSLLVSILMRPELTLEHLHMTTMAVGIAASDAFEEVAGFRPTLKWPNDLVVEEGGAIRKLGGILAEADFEASGPSVVVGVGMNVNWPRPMPPELADIAIAANHLAGRDLDRAALLVCFLQRLDEHYGALLEQGGWRGTLLNYRRLSATLGREVEVDLGRERVRGRAVEVTAEGHLVLDVVGAGLRNVTAGDVVHLRAV
jgi:BirA family biotin operon repressor/biotin-[acetyl-CoA-carboxylase] ligase